MSFQPNENDEQNPPVFVAFVPTSPERHIFDTFDGVNRFLKSPEVKRAGKSGKPARFKKCNNTWEVESFYEENSALDFSLNDSLATPSLLNGTPLEAKSIFSEPEPPHLNRFRAMIERKDFKGFDNALNENPRYILNTSLDGPTILQGSQRHNIMHIAASSGNVHVMEKVLDSITSPQFLKKAYGDAIQDFDALIDHLLDSYLNTPDKNANNTPLHFACKQGYLEIVRRLVKYEQCKRGPMNRFNQTPMDLLCQTFRPQEGTTKEEAKTEIRKLLYSVPTPKKKQIKRRWDGLAPTRLEKSILMDVDVGEPENDEEMFFDALDEFQDKKGQKPSSSTPKPSNHPDRPTTSDKYRHNLASIIDPEIEPEIYFDAFEPFDDSIDKLTSQMEKILLRS